MNKVFLILFFSQNIFAFPVITDWRNSPLIIFENKKNAVLKRKSELKSAFFAVTTRLDELQFNLNPSNEIYLYKNSKIQVNEVFEDTEKPVVVVGLAGSFRVKNKKVSKDEAQVINQIQTVFFDLPQPHDADALIVINPKEPSVEIKMITGSWDLEFYSYEKKVTLKAGQQVKFKGVLAEGTDQIKYDFLLDGKKVPKGQLEKVKKFNVAQYKAEEKAAAAEIIKKDILAKKKIQEDLRKKKEWEDSFLCKKPFAQINQCAWKLEDAKCYRQRCNVSGEWGDKTERPITDNCTKDFLIGRCDY